VVSGEWFSKPAGERSEPAGQARHPIMTYVFDLSSYGKIELAGPDARIFLHNLCTQDVKNLAVGTSCEAFLTNPKARVIAHVWITCRQEDDVWLDMVAGQADKVMQHLDHYLISERVELFDRTKEYSLLRLVGAEASALLSRRSITPMRRHRLLGLDGYDLFCPVGDCEGLRQSLVNAGAAPGDAAAYQTLRIEAGLPEYGIDIDENRLAMEVNRTAQAICYTKGCFLGQETIVMARDRGQVNRLLMGVKVADAMPLVPGTKLFRANEEVGQVTSSAMSPRFSVIGLVYLRRGSWDAGTELTVEAATAGRGAVVCSLPFAP
jgi:folate-binding protein YgfZ